MVNRKDREKKASWSLGYMYIRLVIVISLKKLTFFVRSAEKLETNIFWPFILDEVLIKSGILYGKVWYF